MVNCLWATVAKCSMPHCDLTLKRMFWTQMALRASFNLQRISHTSNQCMQLWYAIDLRLCVHVAVHLDHLVYLKSPSLQINRRGHVQIVSFNHQFFEIIRFHVCLFTLYISIVCFVCTSSVSMATEYFKRPTFQWMLNLLVIDVVKLFRVAFYFDCFFTTGYW